MDKLAQLQLGMEASEGLSGCLHSMIALYLILHILYALAGYAAVHTIRLAHAV